MEIRSDRVYRFPLSRPALWQLLCSVDSYPRWWPWLSRFEAKALEAGDVWRCTVRPPLPYALRGDLRLDTVVEPELIEAELTGDLVGRARIELFDDDESLTTVRLTTELAAASAPIRVASRAVPSLARWGHDWVLDTAARQFRAAIAQERP